ncbi:helix-turn-helix domain-containing protein [[Clostridium] symbiosum]|uniref:helix-turn-helix domain-containing protein n=1 Tax=Clostridium symbiosum TaxID=1512 RepID=UPI0011830246|nr:helix-turn-helix domain-containing protein [[Clostridium] symbiosum]
MDTRREKIEDLLKFEGIECKGFGVLPKFVMRDVDLGIGAKGLYAYYCSLAGSEIVAFPRRETILRQLKINKETFYRYQEELIKEGYISVQQIREKSQLFGANVYTLVQNPKKLQMTRIEQEVKEGYDFAYYAGLKSHGYGIIPRIVMQDPRLDIKAKAIYAYYVVYTGAGRMSYLRRELILQHLGISKNTYGKYMQQLVILDYMAIQQRTDQRGRFASNTYILRNNPGLQVRSETEIEDMDKSLIPCPKKPDTDKSLIPCPKKPDTDKSPVPCPKKPDTDKSPVPCPKKPDTDKFSVPCPKNPDPKKPDNNSINNTSLYNINRSINHIGAEVNRWKSGEIKSFLIPQDVLLSEYEMEYFVNELFGCRTYTNPMVQGAYEMFKEALIELGTSPSERVLKGNRITYAKVIRCLNRLLKNRTYLSAYRACESLLDYAIRDFTTALTLREITDPYKYCMACIWNALVTSEVRFCAETIEYDYPIEV